MVFVLASFADGFESDLRSRSCLKGVCRNKQARQETALFEPKKNKTDSKD